MALRTMSPTYQQIIWPLPLGMTAWGNAKIKYF